MNFAVGFSNELLWAMIGLTGVLRRTICEFSVCHRIGVSECGLVKADIGVR
jgi:hypothetical protein